NTCLEVAIHRVGCQQSWMAPSFVTECSKEFARSRIGPDNLLREKSTDSNVPIRPIFLGIVPVKRLYDKFNDRNPNKFVTSTGISPDNLLLEKSMLLTKSRVVLYSSI
ncbi:hypothetical protein QQP08_013062, partial [Theobroma cacao]